MARSELVLLLALSGCDLVVGISDDPRRALDRLEASLVRQIVEWEGRSHA